LLDWQRRLECRICTCKSFEKKWTYVTCLFVNKPSKRQQQLLLSREHRIHVIMKAPARAQNKKLHILIYMMQKYKRILKCTERDAHEWYNKKRSTRVKLRKGQWSECRYFVTSRSLEGGLAKRGQKCINRGLSQPHADRRMQFVRVLGRDSSRWRGPADFASAGSSAASLKISAPRPRPPRGVQFKGMAWINVRYRDVASSCFIRSVLNKEQYNIISLSSTEKNETGWRIIINVPSWTPAAQTSNRS
jgi:hypothetical protein